MWPMRQDRFRTLYREARTAVFWPAPNDPARLRLGLRVAAVRKASKGSEIAKTLVRMRHRVAQQAINCRLRLDDCE